MNKMKLEGVFPPITTPFNNNGFIEYNHLTENIEKLNDAGTSGYLVLGSSGEFVFLNEEERLGIVSTARKSIPQTKHMLVGVGLESAKCTIELTRKISDYGADVAVVITPHFFKHDMSHDALLKYYLIVSDSSPIPVLLYNVPVFTGLNIDAKTVAVLSSHENIIGIKDSSGDVEQLSEIISLTEDKEFSSLTGSSVVLYPSMCIGASGGIMAIACVLPEICYDIIKMYKEGKHAESKELQMRLIGPTIAVTSRYGIPGLKAAMDLFGFHGGSSRIPLLPISDIATKDIKNIFTNAGFL